MHITEGAPPAELVGKYVDDLGGPLQPTGDALFDRYATAVDRAGRKPDFMKTAKAGPGALADSELAAWEQDFGGDPRYWELRYTCAKGGHGKLPLGPGFGAPADFLREAQRRGLATANTICLLYLEQRAADVSAVTAGLETDALPRPTRLEPQALRSELAILDDAMHLDAEAAWPHYFKALLYFENDDVDGGKQELELGNRAEHCSRPRPYPLSLLYAEPAAVPLGNLLVGGALYSLDLGADENWAGDNLDAVTYRERRNLTTSLDRCLDVPDWELLQAWHGLGLRQGRGGTPLDKLVGVRLCLLCKDWALAHARGRLSEAQITVLERMQGCFDAGSERLKQNGREHDRQIYYVVDLFFDKQMNAFPLSYEIIYRNDILAEDLLANPALALFSQISYPALASPPGLEAYERSTRVLRSPDASPSTEPGAANGWEEK